MSSEARKARAGELARLLAGEAGLSAARRLQRGREPEGVLGQRVADLTAELGVFAGEADGAAAATAPPESTPREGPRPIGIWRPQVREGETVWVRPAPGLLGDGYALRRELAPRRGASPRRVCLLGESVAAGYLYAPHWTPARALEGLLTAAAGEGSWEVIDLARTNEQLGSLVETAEAALQLAPDALVVFAGNNWNLLETPEVSPYAPSVAGRQRYGEALATGGLAGALELGRRRLLDRGGRALSRLAEIAAGAGLPWVAVVPEVNLAHWENRQPVAWLPGEGTPAWWRALGRARRSLAEGRFEAAAAAAWEMVDLDGESCPTSCRLLARAYLGQGDARRAREAAIAEVDAGAYGAMACLAAPQATQLARQLLIRAGERFGGEVVDLRPLFGEWGGGELPGRRLFLDYCHLTAEGMELAMAGAAARLLARVDGKSVGWRDLLREEARPRPSPEAEATARLGAAIHTAHRLLALEDKGPLLGEWCRAALAASPGAAESMRDLLEARAAPVPAVLTAAQRRNLATPCPFLLAHGWRWDHLDADLLGVLAEVLSGGGEDEAGRLASCLVGAFGAGPEPLDLSRAPFLWEPLDRFFPETMAFRDLPGRATYRAPWPESSFVLVAGGSRPVELEATLRLPAIAGCEGCRAGTVELTVNGRHAGRLEAGEGWSRHRVALAPALLRRGLNRVTLAWPDLPPLGSEALASAVRRLELGLEADLHPVFGEVFSLLARAAS